MIDKGAKERARFELLARAEPVATRDERLPYREGTLVHLESFGAYLLATRFRAHHVGSGSIFQGGAHELADYAALIRPTGWEAERRGDAEEAGEWRHIEDAIKMMRGPHQS